MHRTDGGGRPDARSHNNPSDGGADGSFADAGPDANEPDAPAVGDTGAPDSNRPEASSPDTVNVVPDATVIDVLQPDSTSPDVSSGGGASRLCAGGDFAVSSRPGESRFASLAWAGSEYGVAWQDDEEGDNEIYFARVRANGDVISTDRITTNGAADEHPSVGWDGSRYWLAWSRTTSAMGGDSIQVVSLTPSGDSVTVGSEIATTSGDVEVAATPSLAMIPAGAGGGFGVAWEDGRNGDNHEIYYARFSPAGMRVGSDVRVTNASRLSASPILRWNTGASEFGLLWLDDRDGTGAFTNEELYFTRLMPSGMRPPGASDVRVTNEPHRSLWPSMTYDGTGYAISWANETEIPDRPRIYFTLLTPAGTRRPGATDRLLSSNPLDIGAWTTGVAFNGREYLVVWEDQRHTDGDLVIRRLDRNGTPITSEVFLHEDSDFSGHPSLVWGNNEWAIAWEDNRYMHRDIWFRRIASDECR